MSIRATFFYLGCLHKRLFWLVNVSFSSVAKPDVQCYNVWVFKKYWFLVALGLCRCTGFSLVVAPNGLFSSCSVLATLCGGFSSFRAQAQVTQTSALGVCGLSSWGSRALERRLGSGGALGLIAPRHVRPSQTREQIRVSCIGRWTLGHQGIPLYLITKEKHVLLKHKDFGVRQPYIWIMALSHLLSRFVSICFSEVQFPHRWNGDNNSSYFKGCWKG